LTCLVSSDIFPIMSHYYDYEFMITNSNEALLRIDIVDFAICMKDWLCIYVSGYESWEYAENKGGVWL